MMEFSIQGEYIQLDQLLKSAGIADSGGAAHALVMDGLVLVNNVPATEKRKKIRRGDVVSFKDESIGLSINVC